MTKKVVPVFRVSIKHVVGVLAAIAILSVVLHVALQYTRYELGHGQLLGFIDRFDVDNEASFPTWFQQMLLFGGSGLFLYVALCKQKIKQAAWGYWAALSAVFLYLSIDEGSMVHEMFIPIGRSLAGPNLPRFLGSAWVLFGLPVVLVFVAVFARWLWRLPRKTAVGLIAAGAVYVSGTLGMEMINAAGIYSPFVYHGVLVAIEELLEMSGIILLIYTLLQYTRKYHAWAEIEVV